MENIQTKNDSLNNQITSIASGGEQLQKQDSKSQTKATPAFLKAQEYRDQVNAGKEKLMADDFSTVVYLYERNGKACANGYKGRATKTAFNYSFGSVEKRDQYVNNWMEERKKATTKTTKERNLFVGDVLVSSWGYDQTNIDYYLVTKLIGALSVEIVEIGREVVDGDMQGVCVPDKSKIISEPMIKRANDNSVKISSFQWARKKELKIMGGVEIYNADHYSSWH